MELAPSRGAVAALGTAARGEKWAEASAAVSFSPSPTISTDAPLADNASTVAALPTGSTPA